MLMHWNGPGLSMKLIRDLSKYHTRYVKVGGKLIQQIVYLEAPSAAEVQDQRRAQEIARAVWGLA